MDHRWRLALALGLLIGCSFACLGAQIPVFIFAGQSTAICSGTDTGQLSPSQLAPQNNVLLYNARTHTLPTGPVYWGAYQAPTGPGFPNDSIYPNPQGSFGPEFSTANLISQTFYGGGPVGLFKYCVGATSLYNDWNPSNPYLYPDMLSRLSNALAVLPAQMGHTGVVAGFFWTHGASDAIAGTDTAAAYGTNLMNFVLTLRKQFGQSRLPFVYGRLLPQWSNSQGVRDGQQALTNRLRDVSMANADDLYTPTLHYDNNGTITLGNRYADGFASILRSRLSLSIQAGSAVQLRVYGLPNVLYQVQWANDLRAPNWQQLITARTDAFGLFDCEDALPPSTARFYRFVAQ